MSRFIIQSRNARIHHFDLRCKKDGVFSPDVVPIFKSIQGYGKAARLESRSVTLRFAPALGQPMKTISSDVTLDSLLRTPNLERPARL